MNNHSRFDEEHRAMCGECLEAYLDFCQEQADDARLDKESEMETV